MAEMQRFRSALNGFNREDVVRYIEYINNQHSHQIEQLNIRLQEALARQDVSDLQAQLDAALARCAQLEQQLASQPIKPSAADSELEAYRRAERTERLARERAHQIFTQANAILADAALQAETAAANIGVVADQAATQLKQCQDAVKATNEAFQQAIQSLYAIRPEEI